MKHEGRWEPRDIMGIHPQRQEGMFWVGVVVPVGRLFADDMDAFAAAADKYGDGTLRLTVDEHLIIPNIEGYKLAALQQEPIFRKFP